MPSMRHHGALLALATLVACGGAAGRGAAVPTPSPTPRAMPTPYSMAGVAPVRLWLLRSGQRASVDIVEPAVRHTVASFPAGAISPDWSRLYSVSIDAGFGTALHVVDPRSGAQLDRVRVDATMDLPQMAGFGGRDDGLSPSGRRLVLSGGPRDSTGDLVTSLFRVYDTANLHAAPHAVSLPGSFSFDGVDDGGHNLYLVQYQPTNGQADMPAQFDLRRYDLVRDRLDPNRLLPVESGAAPNTGSPIITAVSNDSTWQFTVYGFGSAGPYLDALDLVHGVLHRLALPAASATPAASSGFPAEIDMLWSLVPSRDGRHAYAVNPGAGTLVDITPSPPFHMRTATLPVSASTPSPVAWWQSLLGVGTAEAKRLLVGGATMTADGTLYALGDNGVAVIDTATLQLRRTLVPDTPLQSMALSADGRWLYVVVSASSGGLLQVDTTTGAVVSIPEYGDATGVLRVTASS